MRVAIDVAKLTHQVLLELPSGQRRAMRIANTKTDIDRFVATLRALELPCEIAFEPTGDYHRPLAYVLGQAGFHLCLVSSIAVACTREAQYKPAGKLQMHILGGIAEFERERIRERVLAGLARAKAQGKRLGRPRKVPTTVVIPGGSVRDAASVWGVSKSTAARWITAGTVHDPKQYVPGE